MTTYRAFFDFCSVILVVKMQAANEYDLIQAVEAYAKKMDVSFIYWEATCDTF